MSGPEAAQLSLRRERVKSGGQSAGCGKDVNFKTRLRGLAFRNGLSAAEFTPLECLLQRLFEIPFIQLQLSYVCSHRLTQRFKVVTTLETRNNASVAGVVGPVLHNGRQ